MSAPLWSDSVVPVAAVLRSYVRQGRRFPRLEALVRTYVRLVEVINADPDLRALVDAYARRESSGVEAPGVTAGGSGEAPRCGSRAGDLAAGPYIDPRPGRQPEPAQPDQRDWLGVDGEV